MGRMNKNNVNFFALFASQIKSRKLMPEALDRIMLLELNHNRKTESEITVKRKER